MLVIIPCGGKKRDRRCQAAVMYIGPYFKACLTYARTLASDDSIRILSAKYGLLKLDEEIDPYNIKMGQTGCITLQKIIDQASSSGLLANLDADVVALGGKLYTGLVRKIWPGCALPLDGVGRIGKQLRWLKDATKKAKGRRP